MTRSIWKGPFSELLYKKKQMFHKRYGPAGLQSYQKILIHAFLFTMEKILYQLKYPRIW